MGAATSTTRWTARSSASTRSSRPGTPCSRDQWTPAAGGHARLEATWPSRSTTSRATSSTSTGMVKGIKKSLDYYTTKFGPYQHHQVRIVEFPRYEQFAQSFPNTIPFSESIGFIARVDDAKPDDIDYPFYVTAHEVAHQWWAHQVISGDVQGATLLSETMAQYSALMVMKHEYGADKMKKFLRYELDRYLHGRSTAKRAEMPLVRGREPAVHPLRQGEPRDVRAAGLHRRGRARRGAGEVRREAQVPGPAVPRRARVRRRASRGDAPGVPAPHRRHVRDDHALREPRDAGDRTRSARTGSTTSQSTCTRRSSAPPSSGRRPRSRSTTSSTSGVLGKDGKVLALERKKITTPTRASRCVVDAEPAKAGIDPLNKLIDRMPGRQRDAGWRRGTNPGPPPRGQGGGSVSSDDRLRPVPKRVFSPRVKSAAVRTISGNGLHSRSDGSCEAEEPKFAELRQVA